MAANTPEPIRLFISYAHEDEELREKLMTHLSVLKRQNIISEWHDREIHAGQEWSQEIERHLNEAQITLLLISPDFLASDYAYDIEMKRALERHEKDEAVVIPVILRPVDWQGTPFSKLQALPRSAKPVTTWRDRDEALEDVARGIRKVVERIWTKQGPARTEQGLARTPPTPPVVAGRKRLELILNARLEEVDESRAAAILARLRELSGDEQLTTVAVEPGSVRVILEGTAEGVETIAELFQSGGLSEIEGFRVESVRVVYDDQPEPPAVLPDVGLASYSPLNLLREAIKAVPAVKYALGVAGIASVISIIAGFNVDFSVAVLGTVIMFALMTVLVIFSSLARSTSSLKPLALTLAWSFLVLTIATSVLILLGFFIHWPRPLHETAAGLRGISGERSPTPTPLPAPVTPPR
ncbi:MAG: toll/interleukin-1 receptor domain-containing protein [Pyrinomonadaceae bacterium]